VITVVHLTVMCMPLGHLYRFGEEIFAGFLLLLFVAFTIVIIVTGMFSCQRYVNRHRGALRRRYRKRRHAV
jgi:uncharacterized membrane protein